MLQEPFWGWLLTKIANIDLNVTETVITSILSGVVTILVAFFGLLKTSKRNQTIITHNLQESESKLRESLMQHIDSLQANLQEQMKVNAERVEEVLELKKHYEEACASCEQRHDELLKRAFAWETKFVLCEQETRRLAELVNLNRNRIFAVGQQVQVVDSKVQEVDKKIEDLQQVHEVLENTLEAKKISVDKQGDAL